MKKFAVLYVELEGRGAVLAFLVVARSGVHAQSLLNAELWDEFGVNSEFVWDAETDPRWLAARRAGRVKLLEGTTAPELVH